MVRLIPGVLAAMLFATPPAGAATMPDPGRAVGDRQPAPTVTSVTPAVGPSSGEQAVTIEGTGFDPAATATVGGQPCPETAETTPTTLRCRTTAGKIGPADVVVTNPDSRSGTLARGYTYAALPDMPQGLTLTVISPTAVQASWSAPESSGGIPITQYAAAAGTGADAAEQMCTAAAETSCTLAGLRTGVTYAVRIRARNALGWGPATPAQDVSVITAPAPPAGVFAKADSTRSLQVSWATPTETNGAPPTEYAAAAYREETATTPAGTCGGPALTCMIGGLNPGARYFVKVRARNSAGWSAESRPVRVRVILPPSAPRGARARPKSARSVRVLWHAPAEQGASAVVRYVAAAYLSRAGTRAVRYCVAQRPKGCTLQQLGRRPYYVRVRALNGAGWSPFSRTVRVVPRKVRSR